ncbi:MAG: xylose isomerase [Paenibacillus sp.]|nr:xylose isomerase [Paenibacillus sp.]
MIEQIAVQLHTLREECKADLPGVLRELKRMGYPAVQFAGYYDHDPAEVASVIRETGLRVAGLHVQLAKITENPDQLLKELRLFDTRDIVCSNTPTPMRNEEGFRALRDRLNEQARRWRPEGIRVSYHNHAFEFETSINGQPALRYMLEPEADNLVMAEIDVYWVKKAGVDPLSFLAPYTGRMPIIHLKDMTDDEEQAFAEVGTGSIDFRPILRWGALHGVEWYVVEQDRCRRSPMDSVEISLANLKRMMEEIG